MHNYHHIIAAIDFDDHASSILEKAAFHAECSGAKLSIIHIDPDIAAFYEGIIDIDLQEEKEKLHHESVQLMKSLISRLSYPVERHILYSGSIDEMTLKAVQTYAADLLILGHHKSGRLRQLLISPSQSIVRNMPCDLLLIRLEDNKS